MAKSHYSIKKRKKELARKLKQEQKRQRKLEKNSSDPEEASEEAVENASSRAGHDSAAAYTSMFKWGKEQEKDGVADQGLEQALGQVHVVAAAGALDGRQGHVAVAEQEDGEEQAHRDQETAQHHRRHRKLEDREQPADKTGRKHDPDVEDRELHGVGADNTNRKDHRHQDAARQAEEFDARRDQREGCHVHQDVGNDALSNPGPIHRPTTSRGETKTMLRPIRFPAHNDTVGRFPSDVRATW